MAKPRSKGARIVALAIAVVLITGGITTLASTAILATKIASCVAILAGVVFLGIAYGKRSRSSA